MNGARQYYDIISRAASAGIGDLTDATRDFSIGGDSRAYRNGNVVYRLHTHARGKCFEIILVSEREHLEVYGVTGGHRGWTETYGWLKRGTWVKPILAYIIGLERQLAALDEKQRESKRDVERGQNANVGETVGKFNELFREVLANVR